MAREHVNHSDIAQFAKDKVNLPKEKADDYRAQANRIRDKIETYMSEHPDFNIKRTMLSGSLAKGGNSFNPYMWAAGLSRCRKLINVV